MFLLELLKTILLGIVEGITEWLPISSTGHLILLNHFINLDVSDEFLNMFEVVIQLGAILAVVLLFWKRLWPFGKNKPEKKKRRIWNLWFKIIVGVLPSAIIGFLLDDWFNAHFYNYVSVAIALIVYGVAFIVIERRRAEAEPRLSHVDQVTYRDALLIGAFQVLSIIPGTSRSGSTILGGMLLGLSRGAAAEFSFFLAIPTMVGASLLKIVKFIGTGVGINGHEVVILLLGCLVSFLVSVVTIRFLMDFVKRHTFSAFGIYRIALGALVLIYFLCTL